MAAAPTYLVIGGQKCGSTWLAEMLAAHPEVFTPARKELHFFDRAEQYAKGFEWYESQFTPGPQHRAIGETTPDYLWVHGCRTEVLLPSPSVQQLLATSPDGPAPDGRIVDRVHSRYPDLRLLVILRDPVERALSAFRHQVRQGRLTPRARFRDSASLFGIVEQGFYYAHLAAWLERYPAARFQILIYEDDLVLNPRRTVERVYAHLGVDETFVPDGMSERFNEGVGGFYLHLNYYAGRFARPLFSAVPPLRSARYPRLRITDQDVDDLRHVYGEDTSRLAELLGRPLDRWQSWGASIDAP